MMISGIVGPLVRTAHKVKMNVQMKGMRESTDKKLSSYPGLTCAWLAVESSSWISSAGLFIVAATVEFDFFFHVFMRNSWQHNCIIINATAAEKYIHGVIYQSFWRVKDDHNLYRISSIFLDN
ncbi:unnamed protein product [Sphenostylis stenocarpa]|uniref:Uncharacterized protein n=1 Tax=Sphenostylis stenocarpa TaxID=92480 RepID=A0AA86VX92_9FABA|nr:unnamed protein product [Sphenostylis stenocarpa]